MNSITKLMAVTSLLVGAAMIPAQTHAQFFAMENPLLNQKAPDFTLRNLSGEKINFEKYRDQKPTILFFWATWCPHCRGQLKELNKTKDEIIQKGIKLVTIDTGEALAQVKQYATKNQIVVDILLDQDQTVSENYALIGVPTFFFIDENGVVKSIEHALPKKYDEVFNNSGKK